MVPKYPVDFVFPAQSHSFLSSVPLLLLSRQKFKNNGTEKKVNWSLQQFFILGKAPESESISFTVFLEEKSEKSIAANGDVEPLIAREPSGMERGRGKVKTQMIFQIQRSKLQRAVRYRKFKIEKKVAGKIAVIGRI